ncbi:MAG: hypothetical protein ACOVP8_06925, partial [Phycisphaerales bacterium]
MLSAVLFAAVAPAALAQAPSTLGVMFRTGGQTSGLNPILYDVNLSTGATSNPRNINVNNAVGIAIDPETGVLYGLTDQFGRINNQSGQGGKNLIFTVNATTGAATAVGRVDPTGIFQVFEGDIAFNPVDGGFWGVTTLVSTARLFTIDGSRFESDEGSECEGERDTGSACKAPCKDIGRVERRTYIHRLWSTFDED